MKRKVLAYITTGNNTQLLVFRHEHFPEAGLQVPAGTVEPDEEPTAALWREVKEETGLVGLKLVGQIATEPYFARAKDEWQERNIFHLQTPDELPDTWLHVVTSGDEDAGLHFVYFRLPLNEAAATLVGGQGDWLNKVGR